MRRGGARFAGDDIEEGDDEDDESGEFDSNISDSCDGEGRDPRRGERVRGEVDDEMFDRVMEEYGSDDLGDLEEEVTSDTSSLYIFINDYTYESYS